MGKTQTFENVLALRFCLWKGLNAACFFSGILISILIALL
jgi:hypothetical protein